MPRVSSDLTRPAFSQATGSNSNGRFLPLRERGLFGLAPGGVYLATLIAQGTVGSYPTFSPLPPKTETLEGGMFLWHFPYLCEIGVPPFHRNSPCYGPPCPAELGLSSPPDLPLSQDFRRSGHLFPFDFPPFPLQISKRLKSLIKQIKNDNTDINRKSVSSLFCNPCNQQR